MLLFEPPPTQGDIHFRIAGFPVRVHPFFWVAAVVLGMRGLKGTPPADLVIWVAVVFASILVHELGHAFAFRRFGGRPWITLHAIGGLASCDDFEDRPANQIAIALAGPAAGFVLALVAVLMVQLTGHAIGWTPGKAGPPAVAYEGDLRGGAMLGGIVYWESLGSKAANDLLRDVLQVNIYWGLINLLPIYPLDGGRVSRELCTLRSPRAGIILSLRISVACAAVMAGLGIVAWQSFYTAIMFGYLAYSSYTTLQGYERRGW